MSEHQDKKKLIYQLIRVLSGFFAVIIPVLIRAFTDHQPMLFTIIIPATPFVFIAILSTPPKIINIDKPYAKAGALLFANAGTLFIILGYNIFYYVRTANYSGGGADIGMGMVMMTMPISLLVGISIFALAGEKVGSAFNVEDRDKPESQDIDEPLS